MFKYDPVKLGPIDEPNLLFADGARRVCHDTARRLSPVSLGALRGKVDSRARASRLYWHVAQQLRTTTVPFALEAGREDTAAAFSKLYGELCFYRCLAPRELVVKSYFISIQRKYCLKDILHLRRNVACTFYFYRYLAPTGPPLQISYCWRPYTGRNFF